MVRFQPPSVVQDDDDDGLYDDDDHRIRRRPPPSKNRFTAPMSDDSESDEEFGDEQTQIDDENDMRQDEDDDDDETADHHVVLQSAIEDDVSLNDRRIPADNDDDVDGAANTDDNSVMQIPLVTIDDAPLTQAAVLSLPTRIAADKFALFDIARALASSASSGASSIATRNNRKSYRVSAGVNGVWAFPQGTHIVLTRARGHRVTSPSSTAAFPSLSSRDEQLQIEWSIRSLRVHMDFINTKEQLRSSIQPTSTSSRSDLTRLADAYIQVIDTIIDANKLTSDMSQPYSLFNRLQHARSVFQLAKALFAPEFGAASLSTFLSAKTTSNVTQSPYAERYARTRAVSNWLESQVVNEVRTELSTYSNPLDTIFTHLSAHDIVTATLTAAQNKDFRLATLLPHLSAPSQAFHNDIAAQLRQWQRLDSWPAYISLREREVYSLCSGNISVRPNMSWLRCFGQALWYGRSRLVDGAVNEYQTAVNHGQARPPHAPHQIRGLSKSTTQSNRSIRDDDNDDDQLFPPSKEAHSPKADEVNDTRFELLQVYSGVTTNYSALYSPESSTASLVDYTLSFHLHDTLTYSSLTTYNAANKLQYDYAIQLESMGLWQWAIYVIMRGAQHKSLVRPNDDIFIERSVKDILIRHVDITMQTESIQIDTSAMDIALSQRHNSNGADFSDSFLLTSARISPLWLYQSRAIRAEYETAYQCAYDNRLKCAEWNEAHRVAAKFLLPTHFILKQSEAALNILKTLHQHRQDISDWRFAGELYRRYFDAIEHFDQTMPQMTTPLSSQQRSQLSSQLKHLSAIISAVQESHNETAIDGTTNEPHSLIERACWSEMCNRISHLCRVVSDALGSDDADGSDVDAALTWRVSRCMSPADAVQGINTVTERWIKSISQRNGQSADGATLI